MARKTKTNLTFQVTIPDVQGMTIKDMRQFILGALAYSLEIKAKKDSDDVPFNIEKVKVHLTNKETSYA